MIAEKINLVSENQLYIQGVNALKEALGVTGTIRFLERFDDGGSGDYTKEKYLEEDNKPTKEELISMFK